MIYKHEIPILEFDDNPQAVIMPTHENLDLNLPARCVYAFLEEEIERTVHFHITDHNLKFYGICEECGKKMKGESDED